MISDITSNPNIELLQPQVYENITIIPLKTERNYIDILTLKKGLELGLVNVKECVTSQVNTIIVKNNAITPLILIDGEEIIGGDQNRIVNSTILIDAGSKMKIPVSCSEKNRWAFKSEFKQSEYMANYNTRRAKEYASRVSNSYQDVIWSSIDCLEVENDYASPTSAMEESYKNIKAAQNEIIKQFKIMDGQTGVLIMVDGEIKGFELFLNSGIYRDFHEKIIKSYLIDSKIKNNMFAVNIEAAREVISHAFDCSFEEKSNKGIETAYTFENDDGLGTLYLFKDHIVHWSYFKKDDEKINDELVGNMPLETDI